MNILIFKKSNILKALIAILIIIAGFIGSKNYILDVFNEISDINKLKPISNVATNDSKVAIVFELHENTTELEKTLKILKDNNIKATFFIVGAWAQKNPDSVKLIYNDGHQLGNHSFTHSHSNTITMNDFKQEIKACNKIVKDILGVDMNLYKFPYDDYKNEHITLIYDENLYPTSASVVSNDYKELGKDDIITNVINNKNLKKGAIIEFNIGSKYLNDSLPDIISELHNKELNIVTLNDLIYKENFIVSNDGTQQLNS